MSEKVKFGLSNVKIAARQVASDGTISYATPVALAGAVSLTLSRSTDKSSFRADNINFYTKIISSAREGSFEVAMIPDWFKTAYLGYKADVDDFLVETNASGGAFAICFQVETDTSNKKYVIYNVQCAESDEEHKTTEENDLGVQTSTLELTIDGEQVGDYVCFAKEVGSFDSVALPIFPTSA